jgi:hypothetical protein
VNARRWRFGRSLKPFRRPWLWAGLWALGVAAVVVASLLPAPDLPNLHVSDKAEHFSAYALLAAGAVQLYARRLSWLSVCLALALLGIGLDFAQGALTTTRQMDAADALANSLGVLAGLATSLAPWRDALLRHEPGR